MTDEKTAPAPGTPAGAIPVPPEAVFWQALANPGVPKLYANTFSVVLHPTDIALVFGQAGAVSGMVSLTYAVAKTLADRLQQAVASYEQTVETVVTAAEALEKKFRERPPQS